MQSARIGTCMVHGISGSASGIGCWCRGYRVRSTVVEEVFNDILRGALQRYVWADDVGRDISTYPCSKLNMHPRK